MPRLNAASPSAYGASADSIIKWGNKMITSSKNPASVFALSILVVALSACQKNDNTADKGPAEKVGKQLDQAAAKAAVEINKAAEQAGKGLEKAGESLQNTAKDAKAKDEKK
jgi:hypothetical protein